MWKIFSSFLTPVNSRERDEHPSYSPANYVPAGGRNPAPPRKAIVLAGQARNKPLSIMATEMVLRRMQIENRNGSRPPIEFSRLGRKRNRISP